MSFKLNKLVAVTLFSLVAATSANAATVPGVTPSSAELGSGANGSSLIFSAWDDAQGVGYSIDLGTTLNSFLGADTLVSGSAGSSTNSMVAATTATSSSTLTFALPDWNLSSGVFNVVAADTTGRYRVLTTNADANWTGTSNSQIKAAGNNLNNYLGLGAALSTSAGTLSSTIAPDAWYAGSTSWGANLGTNGFAGSAVDLNSTSYLYLTYQKSTSTSNGNPALAGGVAAVTSALGGQYWTASLSNIGGVEYLTVAAVPEADTSAMMLAGIGLMGFIARRRKAKQV